MQALECLHQLYANLAYSFQTEACWPPLIHEILQWLAELFHDDEWMSVLCALYVFRVVATVAISLLAIYNKFAASIDNWEVLPPALTFSELLIQQG